MFIFTTSAKNTNGSNKCTYDSKKVEEKVIDYLENSVLVPNFGGQVFADFYELGKDENKLFNWAYICEYYKENGQLKLGSAHSGPMIIFFAKDGSIKDHWEPKPGQDYSETVRARIPEKYQEEILNFQTKHKEVINDLKESVKKRARQEKTVKEEADKVLSPGEVITIKLDANRTTGYKWFYHIEDKDIIEVISDKYIEHEHRKDLVGVGGQRIFNIKGLKTGITTIKLEYYREWNPKKIDRTREIKIKVQEKSKISFDIPDNLETEYISVRDWEVKVFDSKDEYPPEFNLVEGRLSCKKKSAESNLPTKMGKRTIHGQKYCIKSLSQGAAGSIYTEYTYATVKSNDLVTVSLTVCYPQCVNYDQRRRSECQKERQEFDLDQVVHQVVESVESRQVLSENSLSSE